jgi:hypothetical protein
MKTTTEEGEKKQNSFHLLKNQIADKVKEIKPQSIANSTNEDIQNIALSAILFDKIIRGEFNQQKLQKDMEETITNEYDDAGDWGINASFGLD